MSITNQSFDLPVIVPEMYRNTFGTGANAPVLITGISETNGEARSHVVKLLAGERMSEDAFFRELMACFLAIELDIPVVKPSVILIGDDFVEANRGRDCYQRLLDSKGYNFGSIYLENGFQVIPTALPFNKKQLEHAKNIFWFDMLIQNPDRTLVKPNMLTDGEKIVIFDHELAFSFLLLLSGDAEPWVVTREKYDNYNNLILPRKLKKKVNLELSDIRSRINRLNDGFWDKAVALTPAAWFNKNHFVRIQNHIDLVKRNVSNFVRDLQHLLS